MSALPADAGPGPGFDAIAVASPRQRVGSRVGRGVRAGFWLAVGWLVLVTGGAVFAPVLPLPPPDKVNVLATGQGPGLSHLLGTDELGRDILSRLAYGGRVSLVVGLGATLAGLAVGGLLGVAAGYWRGRVDALISVAINAMLAFPAIIFALAAAAFLGPSLANVVGILAVLSVAPYARFLRGIAVAATQREYVTAARMLGYRNRRILLREVVPNIVPAALSFAFVGIGVAIAVEGALSFLGLSVRPPAPSWGNMIAEGGSYLPVVPLLSVWPSLCLLVTILALNVVGEQLRRRFDVREGGL